MDATTFRDSVINYLWLDANNFFPSIESRPNHFSISARSVQMSPYGIVNLMQEETNARDSAKIN